ncbi:FecR family protein [Pedobacter sp. AW31-3R]|uniref:FecR family protein n=1 Tax=Pedobacter sp. AW31-3R TaxID=3445781 RepID=UPI003FA0DEED
MNQQDADRLLQKYLDQTASPGEQRLIESWYAHEATIRKLNDKDNFEHLAEVLWQGTRRRAGIPILKKVIPIRYYWWSAAAILLLGMSIAYLSFREIPSITTIARAKDIRPGTNKAILTLGNGKQIALSNDRSGKLASEDHTTISKTDSGKVVYEPEKGLHHDQVVYNTITTPAGGQFQLRLADGTNITLDASSSISFPVVFSGKQRAVTMTGQAYFEVAHDKDKPFIVKTAAQNIEVLGTHFNVNAYENEQAVKTTLLTGSIRLKAAGHQAILKPGEQALVLPAAQRLEVGPADMEESIAWQQGYFRFRQEDIHAVMRKISRWYNIEVTFEGAVPAEKFSGTISRYKDISQVLGMLEYSKSVHFKLSGRRVTVYK